MESIKENAKNNKKKVLPQWEWKSEEGTEEETLCVGE